MRHTPIWIDIPIRIAPRIPIHTRPINEAERIGLGVAAQAWIAMAMPAVMQAGFELEPLAGEAEVHGERAGERLNGAPGLVFRTPLDRLAASDIFIGRCRWSVWT